VACLEKTDMSLAVGLLPALDHGLAGSPQTNIATRMGILSRRIARLADFCHLTGAEPVFSR